MARPRRGVTLENSTAVHSYFSAALKDYSRVAKLLADSQTKNEAIAVFIEIPSVVVCDIERCRRLAKNAKKNSDSDLHAGLLETAQAGERIPDPCALDEWVLMFVSKQGWKQCLSCIRQARHASTTRNPKATLKISRSTAFRLKHRAKVEGQTLDECIRKLLDG